ncbi:MAG: hydantoinase/oxoprolinase family protein, partial [Chloroflexi bacterium]|nr:hydantoinase/oxoprolinase family protein [Chloroflexota bacterium]
EYERTSATSLNAYVLPQVARYHRRLEGRLEELRVSAPLRIMKSNGGMYSAKAAASQPIHTALSGPAAAVVGAIVVGEATGQPNVISIDVGGTSADICLSRDGRPEVTTEGEIAGLPLNVPMVDVHTIGAGGGSIARLSPSGSLLVGPESAGAEPGPVCYGRGGTEPTVTDANLALGRIAPALVGGEVTLELALAERAIADRVGRPLGLDVLDAADGIVEILNNNMAAAIRAVSVEKGYDPREFALVAGGGAGPLHGCRLAELLGIPLVIVPASAGLLSTLGLLATDLKNDYVQTNVQRAGSYDLGRINAGLAELEREAVAWLERESVPPERRTLTRAADLRYANQGYEITVPLDDGRGDGATGLDRAAMDRLVERFHQQHERLYTWSSATLPVELVNLRVTAYGELAKLGLSRYAGPNGAGKREIIDTRRVHFGRQHGSLETPVYDFDALAPGWHAIGPAIVEQRFSTVVILPHHEVRLDEYANLLIEVPRASDGR